MEEVGLSKVDVWHLENVILRLYKVIVSCYDLCSLYFDNNVFLSEKWEEKDMEIADFYLKPQRCGYLSNVMVQLTPRTFEDLFMFIIEQNDFALAMDFIQPKLHLNHLIQTMKTIEESVKIKFSSIDFIGELSDFITEVYRWAAVYSSRINSSIDKEMEKRKIMTYSLICDEISKTGTVMENAGNYNASGKRSFELSNYFVNEYDNQCISRIFQFLNFLNTQKGASYIAKIASIIAIAWENHLLCETYNNTLQAVFNYFGIIDKIDNYKPARLRRSNYKGTIPLARAQAMKFFQSIDNRTLMDVS